MHICFLTSEYPPLPHGGIGTSIQNLAQELVKQGNRVTVLGWGQKLEFEDHGVEIRFLQSTGFPKMGWFLNRRRASSEIKRMVREEELDIVESPDWSGLSAGMQLDCPLVIRCHGSDSYFGSLLGYQPRLAVRLAESIALHHNDAITAVSRFAAQRTSEIFHLTENITTIPNGIDINRFSPVEEPDHSNVILYLGTLVRKKGVFDLCEIFNIIVKENKVARLWLIGRDVEDKLTKFPSTWEIAKQMLTPEALNRTNYFGTIPYNNVQDYLKQASICVFPSYAETFGLSWIEAMACAKPVVASNIGWANEIIEDGVSGILIHPSDHLGYVEAIQDLLSNPDKRRQMGLNARRRVEQLFSIQRTAELSLEWYQDVINAHS